MSEIITCQGYKAVRSDYFAVKIVFDLSHVLLSSPSEAFQSLFLPAFTLGQCIYFLWQMSRLSLPRCV